MVCIGVEACTAYSIAVSTELLDRLVLVCTAPYRPQVCPYPNDFTVNGRDAVVVRLGTGE
jgi:hypothetical protein